MNKEILAKTLGVLFVIVSILIGYGTIVSIAMIIAYFGYVIINK